MLDAVKARQTTDEAIARCERRVTDDDRQLITDCVLYLCTFAPNFTVDDFYRELGEGFMQDFDPDHVGKLGPILRSLAGRGWIRKTGVQIRCIRPEAHMKYNPVWEPTIEGYRAGRAHFGLMVDR